MKGMSSTSSSAQMFSCLAPGRFSLLSEPMILPFHVATYERALCAKPTNDAGETTLTVARQPSFHSSQSRSPPGEALLTLTPGICSVHVPVMASSVFILSVDDQLTCNMTQPVGGLQPWLNSSQSTVMLCPLLS